MPNTYTRTNAKQRVSQSQHPATTHTTSVFVYVALALAACALVFACMPWFYTSATLTGSSYLMNGFVDEFTKFTGGSSNYSAQNFSVNYAPWRFLSLSKSFQQFQSMLGMSTSIPMLITFFFIMWMASVITMMFGVVRILSDNIEHLFTLYMGLMLLAATSIGWVLAYEQFVESGFATGLPTYAIFCALFGLGSLTCFFISFMNKRS